MGDGFEIRMEGTNELQRAFDALGSEADKVLASALRIEAEKVMAVSVRQVPVDTGVLRASQTIGEAEGSGDDMSISLGYGGAASDYAWVQHERTDYRHTVGKAKYLSDPVAEAASGPFVTGLAETVQAWLKQAGR
jgi:hypothetical protein